MGTRTVCNNRNSQSLPNPLAPLGVSTFQLDEPDWRLEGTLPYSGDYDAAEGVDVKEVHVQLALPWLSVRYC